MSETIRIIDIKPFCLYKDREVGIAIGCFAGEMFKEKPGLEYIEEVMGDSFNWLDEDGLTWKDSKRNMKRPTTQQVVQALKGSNSLIKYAETKGYIEVKNER